MIPRIAPPAVIALMVGYMCIGSLSAESIIGHARVIDGDTIVIGATHIRLAGIDAPESKQDCIYHGKAYHCGRFATAKLARISVRQSVRCESEGRDRYGRTLANCWVGDVNINQSMVATGWAVAYVDIRIATLRTRQPHGVVVSECGPVASTCLRYGDEDIRRCIRRSSRRHIQPWFSSSRAATGRKR